jgi:hypothetical protein
MMTTTGNETDQNTVGQTNVVVLPHYAEPQSAREKATAFVREHPALTLAGGLAVGALAAALIPRRNRAYVARQGSLLAEAIAAAGATIAQQALASLDTASTSVRERAHTLAARAEQAGGAALDKADRARHAAYDRAQTLLGRSKPAPTFSERLAARAGEIAGRLRG